MILLCMLKQGLDIYGIDISAQMLKQLFAKAEKANIPDVQKRVTPQNMVDFRLDVRFEAIFIPARLFLLMAKLAGFSVSHFYTGFDKAPCNGEGELIWELKKAVES